MNDKIRQNINETIKRELGMSYDKLNCVYFKNWEMTK